MEKAGKSARIIAQHAVNAACASGGLVAAYTTGLFPGMPRLEVTRCMLIVFGLMMTALYIAKMTHFLNSRLSYRSTLYMMSLSGTIQESRIELGNNVRGKVKASSSMMRITDARLKLWSGEIESLAYEIGAARFITSMQLCNDNVLPEIQRGLVQASLRQKLLPSISTAEDLVALESLMVLDRQLDAYSESAERQIKTAA